MNILVLAGGYATRLGKLTKNYPKFLLRLAGKPVLYYLLERIKQITDIHKLIIAFDENYQHFFLNDIEKISASLNIYPSLSIHGTGSNGKIKGPIKKISDILDNPEFSTQVKDFLVVGGDNIFDLDLNEFCSFYRRKTKSCVAIKKIIEPMYISQFGIPILDDTDRLIDFEEKPIKSDSNLISTACYAFRRNDIFLVEEYLDSKLKDNLGEFIRWLISKSQLYGYIFQEDWYDIGTREGILSANRFLMSKDENRTNPNLVYGSTTIKQPVYINNTAIITDSKIGSNVYIGARASIIQSVIEDSIIYNNCIVENSKLRNLIVGDNSIVKEEDRSDEIIGPNYGQF